MVSYNIKYPINDDVDTNTYFQTSKVTKDAFSSNLLLLLLTQKNERYYDPNYGTNLLKMIFDQNDNLTANDIEQEIKNAVSLYIPALKINSVAFYRNTDDKGQPMSSNQLNLNIKFTYSEDAYSEQGELLLNF